MIWLVLFGALGLNDITHRTLIVDADIVTKTYVQVEMPDQQRLEVPVVNGWLPAVDTTVDPDGKQRLIFDYRGRIKWTGQNNRYMRKADLEQQRQAQSPPQVAPQPVAPPAVVPPLPKPITLHQDKEWRPLIAPLETKRPSEVP
jgi:hypothetical protein